jgi:hypothetical protein
MNPEKANGRAARTRPLLQIIMDQAGAATLNGQNVTDHHEGDAGLVVPRQALAVQSSVAAIPTGSNAHDCRTSVP